MSGDQPPWWETVPEILKEGRSRGLSAVELAELCCNHPQVEPMSVLFMASFKIAFGVPLTVMQQAASWERYYSGEESLSDDEFNQLLSKWI